MERLFEYYKPNLYKLKLFISRKKDHLQGETHIEGEAKGGQLKLHAEDMQIGGVQLNGRAVEFKHEDGLIIIDDAPAGQVTLDIQHSSSIDADMQGAYYGNYNYQGEKRRMVMTQFESHYARECFPCVDEPEAKAKFQLSLTSADPEDTLLSNMPVVKEAMDDRGKTCEFAETPRMASYLVAFAAGRFISYRSKSRHGVEITSYACEHQEVDSLKLAGDFAADVLDYYDDLFKTPYPLPKLDLLAAPDFDAGAMENWGLMTFRESAMLATKTASVDKKCYISTVVAHEISHMWFGDLVTMKWWDDLWLNEAFANTMELYATQKVRPEYSAWDDFYDSTVQAALRRDCLPGVQPIHVQVHAAAEIDTIFDGSIVYAKGGRMVVMLMHVMGEENFFKGVADYFKEHQYQNTVADDLWRALSKYADFDVKEFMDPWLYQPGYPVVDENGENQHRFLLSEADTEENYHYPIRNFSDDMSGHYIIKLSDAALQNKIDHIDSLGREQKLRLLTDRRLLALSDEVESASLMPLLLAFKDEKDAAIWDLMTTIVCDLRLFFTPDTEEKRRFSRFVQALARPQYERLGLEARPGEDLNDTKIRVMVMGMLAYAKDEGFTQDVSDKYSNIYIGELISDVRQVIASVLVRLDPSRVDDYYNIYKSTNDPSLRANMSNAICSATDRNILLPFLDELKTENIRPQDRLFFWLHLASNHYTRKDALNWIYANWDWLYASECDKSIGDYPRYMARVVREEDEFAKYQDFFAKFEQEPSMARAIKLGIKDIRSKLALIQHDSPKIYEYLAANYQ